jgi:hypothetical protein
VGIDETGWLAEDDFKCDPDATASEVDLLCDGRDERLFCVGGGEYNPKP